MPLDVGAVYTIQDKKKKTKKEDSGLGEEREKELGV